MTSPKDESTRAKRGLTAPRPGTLRKIRDALEVRPPGRDRILVDDFDEFVAYRYGKCWLHVEQMNDFDFFFAIYGAGNRIMHMNVRLGKKGSGEVEITMQENTLRDHARGECL